MDTIDITSAAAVELLAASGTARWLVVAVTGGPIRVQYDGGDGSTLSDTVGELVLPGDKLALEGAPALNPVYAIAINYDAIATVQTGPEV